MYSFCRALGRLIFFCARWRVSGMENIPAGPAILAANHVSNWDPVAVGCAFPRTVHFMAKEELFQNSLLRWFLGTLHAFPVKRGTADRKAIRTAIELLQAGEVVGIFPEGTRNKTNEALKPEPGIALLALKARVPVIPVALIGVKGILPHGYGRTFRVVFGQPLVFDDYYDSRLSTAALDQVSTVIMNKISDLLLYGKDFDA